MIPVVKKWICNIDIVGMCNQSCAYCARHMNHLRADQKTYMSLDAIENAMISLKDWPNAIGISGGEPLLHPQFPQVCDIIRDYFYKSRVFLFTSHRKNMAKYEQDVADTFGVVHIHEHTFEEKLQNKHQRLTMAVGDVVEDPVYRAELIENCWAHKYWAPSINERGATFCEIAAGIARMFDMNVEFPVEPRWWEKDFTDQVSACCNLCGMPVPMYTQLMADQTEVISRGLYNKMRDAGMNFGSYQIFDGCISKEAMEAIRPSWTPWHYRISDGATKNPCTDS